MANKKFQVIFTGANQAADVNATAVLQIRKRKKHPSNDDDAENDGAPISMTRDNPGQVPAKFSWVVDLPASGAGFKRLGRVVAKKGNAIVAIVDCPSPDRL